MARGSARRVSDGRCIAGIGEAFDWRVRPHIPIEVPCPSEIHPDHADGCALGIGAQDRGGADPDREVGGAGNHRLQRVAAARRAEDIEDEAMLLEDAGALTEPRRIDRPQPELPDRNLVPVPTLARRQARSQPRAEATTASADRAWTLPAVELAARLGAAFVLALISCAVGFG